MEKKSTSWRAFGTPLLSQVPNQWFLSSRLLQRCSGPVGYHAHSQPSELKQVTINTLKATLSVQVETGGAATCGEIGICSIRPGSRI